MGNKRAFNRDVVAARSQGKDMKHQFDDLKRQLTTYRAALHDVVLRGLHALDVAEIGAAREAFEALERNTREPNQS